MKIWMSQKTKDSNRYAGKMIFSVLGCAILAGVLTFGVTILALEMGWSIKVVSVITVAGVTVLLVWLAVQIGKRGVRDALVFFQDDEYRFYVLDSRWVVRTTRRHFENAVRIQKFLDDLKAGKVSETNLKSCSRQIMRVEKMKLMRDGYSLVCLVRYPSGALKREFYLLYNGYENEDSLINTLQRRMFSSVEVEEKTYFRQIALSVSGLGVCIVLCVLSHPVVSILPQVIYFPCLFIFEIPLIFVIYYIVKQRRGL